MPRRKKTEEKTKAQETETNETIADRVVAEAAAAAAVDKKPTTKKSTKKNQNKEETPPPNQEVKDDNNNEKQEKKLNMNEFVNSVIQQVSFLTKTTKELKDEGELIKEFLKTDSTRKVCEEKNVVAQFSAKLESVSREIRTELSQFSSIVIPRINQLEREVNSLKTNSTRQTSNAMPPVIKSKPPQPPRK